ncbi:MAG: hypothetical protein U5L02_16895 [Rheinheimera sp.]|nr:hypothetical protein [Rheinheimera sp.]
MKLTRTNLVVSSYLPIVILVLITQSVLLKMRMDDLIPLIGYFDELIVLTCLLFLLLMISKSGLVFSRSVYVLLFVIYSLWALSVTVFSKGNFFLGFQQYFIDSKFFIIAVVASSFLACKITSFEKILKFILVINIPFIIMQWILPDLFNTVFPRGGDGLFALMSGVIVPRFSGVFDFAGILSAVAAAGLCYFWFAYSVNNNKKNVFYVCLALALLMLTISRAEFLAAVTAIFLTSMLSTYGVGRKMLYIAIVVITLFLSFFLLQEYLFHALVELGMITYGYDDLAPRALFLNTSLSIANDFFPFGSGLGTFGGVVAANSDSDFYYKYLIAYEWYYQYGWFLTDTYWPKFIAESGYIGSIFYFYFCFFM